MMKVDRLEFMPEGTAPKHGYDDRSMPMLTVVISAPHLHSSDLEWLSLA